MHVCDEETSILQRENPESKERIIIEKYFEMHTLHRAVILFIISTIFFFW